MLLGLLVCRAGTDARDAFVRERDAYGIGVGVGTLHLSVCFLGLDNHVLDHTAFGVVQSSEEGASTEKPSEPSVRESGKSLGNS
jgi:hypothetical protein